MTSEHRIQVSAGEPRYNGKYRVVIGSPVSEELCKLIEENEPRVEVVRNQDLYPPMRFAADHFGDPEFTRTEEQQKEFEEMLDSADILYGVPDMDPSALARTVRANPNLKYVQTMPAGGGAQVKGADLTREELDRITFTTSAGVHGSTLAEFALFAVLAGAKNLPKLAEDQKNHNWPTNRWEMRQISDMTVLVLGLGGIGKEVAKKFKALGATVWGTSRSAKPVENVDRVITLASIVEAAPEIDAIVVTLPGTDSTEGAVNADFFKAAKSGLIVTNVGRGSVIDEEALIEALNHETVAFAGLDVTSVEPLPKESALWNHPKVLISPHTAALSDQESRRITEIFIRNLTAFIDGEPMINVVDTVAFY
ncbi:D-2-hydroxyacid dehydrogenase [Rothia aerolata]|uniref:2-hydroxyacid dehydrogenase n=1 Tax=Rothia aerolata TaxID=1812262 RepID=A0A917MV43_9MICC|nr:D-2-hydroxyacid dehydrogenase [Rothia aerolata]GGH65986.1 2-hydroxyacid dehydrogenase [Rothia aerolata]